MVTLFLRIFYFFLFFISCSFVNAQEITWAETFGTAGNDSFQHSRKGSDGALYATGSSGGQIVLAKYHENGTSLWNFSLGGGADIARAITLDAEDNVYITGYFSGDMTFDPEGSAPVIPSTNTDLFVAKYDSEGNYLWAKSFSGSGTDNGLDVSISPDGHCYVTGAFAGTANYLVGEDPFTVTSSGGKDVVVLKYDLDGNLISVHQIDDTSTAEGRGISVDKDNFIYISGNFRGSLNLSPTDVVSNSSGNDDFFIAKFNNDFVLQWYYRGSSSQTNQIRRMNIDTVNQVLYFTGRYQTGSGAESLKVLKNGGSFAEKELSNDGNYDTFLMQIGFSGSLNWVGKGGGAATQIGDDIAINSNGEVYLSGIYSGIGNSYFEDGLENNIEVSPSTETGSYFAKYSLEGELLLASSLATATVNSEAYGIVVYDNGYGAIAGFYAGQGTFPPLETEPISTDNGNDFYVARFRECTSVPLSIAIEADKVEACSNATVSFTSTITNGGETPTYQWLVDGSPLEEEEDATLLIQGWEPATYEISLQVVSSVACGETKTSGPVSITVIASPVVTINAVGPLCSQSDPVNLVASETGGQWSGAGIVDPTAGTFDPSAASVGVNTVSYEVEVAGCMVTAETYITVNAVPTAPSVASNGPLCIGDPLQLTTTAEGVSYLWTGPNNFSSTARNPVIASVSELNAGVYQLVVTQNNCESEASSVEVLVNPSVTPVIVLEASAILINAGDMVNFTTTASEVGPIVAYQWYVDDVLVEGENEASFSSTSLTDGQVVKVEVISQDECNTVTTAFSNEITIQISEVTGVNEIGEKDIFKIYPVPVKDVSTIEINNAEQQEATFSLYNSKGTLVNTLTTRGNLIRLEKGTLKPGVYGYILFFNGRHFNGKLIID